MIAFEIWYDISSYKLQLVWNIFLQNIPPLLMAELEKKIYRWKRIGIYIKDVGNVLYNNTDAYITHLPSHNNTDTHLHT